LFAAGISAPIRRPRGRDIMAACGQLKSDSVKLSRAELDRRAAEKQAALPEIADPAETLAQA
jgi:23S rRNA (adenine2503-C2)-methyltransferase